MKIVDLVEDYTFGKLFRVIQATLQYRRFDGRLSAPVSRINFERGDSVGVLLHDLQNDTVVSVRQFCYPVYASLNPLSATGMVPNKPGPWKSSPGSRMSGGPLRK